MKELLEKIKKDNLKVSSSVEHEESDLNLHLKLNVSKGGLTEKYNFYGIVGVYTSSTLNKKYLDVDINDSYRISATFEGFEVEVSKLLESLVNMGLKSVAQAIKITDEEFRMQAYQAVNNSKLVQQMYGNLKVLATTPLDEQLLFNLSNQSALPQDISTYTPQTPSQYAHSRLDSHLHNTFLTHFTQDKLNEYVTNEDIAKIIKTLRKKLKI